MDNNDYSVEFIMRMVIMGPACCLGTSAAPYSLGKEQQSRRIT